MPSVVLFTDASQAVYSKEGRTGDNFLTSMKNALKALANVNDERTSSFPLVLEGPDSGISRLSAHLHLFHHQVSETLRPIYERLTFPYSV